MSHRSTVDVTTTAVVTSLAL